MWHHLEHLELMTQRNGEEDHQKIFEERKNTSKVKCQEPSYATNPIEILRCILHSTHLEKVLFTESHIHRFLSTDEDDLS